VSCLITISAIGIPLYIIMRLLSLGRLSSQIVAVGSPSIGVLTSRAWEVHPLAGASTVLILMVAMFTVLFVVISAEIDAEIDADD